MAPKRRSLFVLAASCAVVVGGATLLGSAAKSSTVRLPSSDAEVLERVPSGAADPRERERMQLQRLLAARPADRRTALALARLDIELARTRSDPRYLGYAQAALGPWWKLDSPPPDVLVLRATIRQSSHDFDGALDDLDHVLASNPGDAQAWLTRSVVFAVQGRYEQGKASCAPLARLTTQLVFAVCETSIDALSGAAGPAYDRLAAALGPDSSRLSPRGEQDADRADEREWATSTLGEIALRLGREADAERAFRAALSIEPGDAYVLGALADLLLDQGRAREAADLVGDRTDNDALLLRLVLAEVASRAKKTDAHAALLASRFDASHLRGDTVHRREEARFLLAVRGDAPAALALARANWNVQREPWDVRIMLESALAANSPAAADEALAFVREHGLEDPRIEALVAKFAPVRP